MVVNIIEKYGIELILHSFGGDTSQITDSILSIEYEENFSDSSDRLTIVFDDFDMSIYNFFEQGDIVSFFIGTESKIGSGKMEVAQMNGSILPGSFEIDAVSKYTVENTMEALVSVSTNKTGQTLYKILRNAAITAGFDTVIIDDEFKKVIIKNVTHRRIKIKNLIKQYIDKFGGFIKVANFTMSDGSEKKHIYIHKKKFFLVDQTTNEKKEATYKIERHVDDFTRNNFFSALKNNSDEKILLKGFSSFKWEQPSIEINEFENDYTDPRTGQRYVSKKQTVYKSGTRIKKATRVESDNESKVLAEAFEDKQEVINISFTYSTELVNIRAGETIELINFFPVLENRRYLITNVSHTIDSDSGWLKTVNATSLE